jgi:hypothetical protein
MGIEEAILEKVRALPPEKQEQVLKFVDSLSETPAAKPLRDPEGLWAHFDIDISEEGSPNFAERCGRTSREMTPDGERRRGYSRGDSGQLNRSRRVIPLRNRRPSRCHTEDESMPYVCAADRNPDGLFGAVLSAEPDSQAFAVRFCVDAPFPSRQRCGHARRV